MLYFQSRASVIPGEGNMEKYHRVLTDIVPIILRNGGKIIGAWETTVGDWGEVLIIEAYKDMAHYEQARAKMSSDPAWQPLLVKLEGLRTVKVHLMKAAPYSPFQ